MDVRTLQDGREAHLLFARAADGAHLACTSKVAHPREHLRVLAVPRAVMPAIRMLQVSLSTLHETSMPLHRPRSAWVRQALQKAYP
eukprot:626679-Rhodomonas_salina.1